MQGENESQHQVDRSALEGGGTLPTAPIAPRCHFVRVQSVT
jgi:hypothetical protein